jgi:hypothetical protein
MYFAKGNNGLHFYFYNTSDVEITQLKKVWVSFNLKDIMMEEKNEHRKTATKKN